MPAKQTNAIVSQLILLKGSMLEPPPRAISSRRMMPKGITLLMFETVAMFQLATSALKAFEKANICEQATRLRSTDVPLARRTATCAKAARWQPRLAKIRCAATFAT